MKKSICAIGSSGSDLSGQPTGPSTQAGKVVDWSYRSAKPSIVKISYQLESI